MSRLDYITIGIVAACICAIIFLVYKMTDLFNNQPGTDPIENTATKVESEDDTYDYGDEESQNDDATSDETDSTSGGANGSTDEEEPTNAGNTDDVTTDDKPENTPKPADNTDTATKPNANASFSSGGKFMVIAGTFSQKTNAKKLVSDLKKLGYNNAAVETFDRGKYAVVLVDRFSSMSSAERLVKDLKAEGVSSYVKTKESN